MTKFSFFGAHSNTAKSLLPVTAVLKRQAALLNDRTYVMSPAAILGREIYLIGFDAACPVAPTLLSCPTARIASTSILDTIDHPQLYRPWWRRGAGAVKRSSLEKLDFSQGGPTVRIPLPPPASLFTDNDSFERETNGSNPSPCTTQTVSRENSDLHILSDSPTT